MRFFRLLAAFVVASDVNCFGKLRELIHQVDDELGDASGGRFDFLEKIVQPLFVEVLLKLLVKSLMIFEINLGFVTAHCFRNNLDEKLNKLFLC